jgi:predicted amidophosphoribosyltransferase
LEKVIALLMVSLVNAEHFDAVAPIALYRTRLTRRGFNQAELMAKSDAARINVPVSDKLKVVCRTTDQVELSADTRRSNVAGAYAL